MPCTGLSAHLHHDISWTRSPKVDSFILYAKNVLPIFWTQSCLQRELRRQAAGGHNNLVLIELRANAA